MSAFDVQAELALRRKPARTQVPSEMVRTRRSAGAAFTLACDASGLEDKEIYSALDLDPGTFSRIKSGKNTLAADMIRPFCEVVGNTVYPEWIAYTVGCGLVVLQTESERRALEAEARAAEAEKKLAWALELMGRGRESP
ncbi:transcriptional regulator [Pseudazoarcus pumilus]|uniref:Transcriptional regulator n=1 Tax=Pseudazoarcus pumilus TaxID=2067960 RepID=A0A2I6S856_9RHOO|nr:transcriptional regulator [Pseudazoarcus pumilus]AUN95422.1 transcriptional regulator [Pseudazoarcus pumilus]